MQFNRTFIVFILFSIIILGCSNKTEYQEPDNTKNQTNIDPGYEEWENLKCQYGKTTTGCAPAPSNEELPRQGSWIQVISPELNFLGGRISKDNDNITVTIKALNIKKEYTNGAAYNLMVEVKIFNEIMWLETGGLWISTLGGHFMEWRLEGFKPEVGDSIKVSFTREFGKDKLGNSFNLVKYEVSS